MNARIIAFYLPQFYPFKENDEWWGKGFTEWTNVGKAKPLFPGHYQPRVPADLGYYDLRLPEVREQQAELAREAGIEGFCYWHYWFDQKRQLLDRVFNEVLASGTPTLPFCLGWANHSWYSKTWEKRGTDKLLCEQKYLGKKDYDAHFQYALKAFKDERYIKVNGRPLFYIFDPVNLPDDFIPYWNELASQNNIEKIYFIGSLKNKKDIPVILQKGFDAINPVGMSVLYNQKSFLSRLIYRAFKLFSWQTKFTFEYGKAMKIIFDKDKELYKQENIIPTIMPQWDHSPRSGRHAHILHGSTPKKFAKHVNEILNIIRKKNNKIVILKSWNEWGEGNYMEPDLKYGKQYIKALRETLEMYNNQNNIVKQ